jgi:hypothetical protein
MMKHRLVEYKMISRVDAQSLKAMLRRTGENAVRRRPWL